MAAQPRVAFRAVRTLTGTPVPREGFPEAATQTFKLGAVVVLSAGYLQEAGADPALLLGIAAGPGKNGTAAGDKVQTVDLAHPGTVFLGNLDNGSGTVTSAATDRGKMRGIAKHSGTGKWYVDDTDSTNKRVVVWGFWDGVQDGVQAAPGDTLAQVYFQFDQAYFQGSKTS